MKKCSPAAKRQGKVAAVNCMLLLLLLLCFPSRQRLLRPREREKVLSGCANDKLSQ
jgi:hypothetical protein